MPKKSQIFLLLGLILMTTPFFLPLWKITLQAPQYPESLGMYIWLDRITGENPSDLQNINILNHYIGMKPIKPGEIPELKIMKPVLIGILLFGFTVLVFRRRALLMGWLAITVVLSLLGLLDFYLWEYHYGHNLDPNAPIKIPGMSYQPPFIGTKTLLNIKASSYPHLGGILFGLGVALAFISLWIAMKHREEDQPKEPSPQPTLGGAATACALLLFFLGCTPKPEPIQFGKDLCHFCSMKIMDQRYGAELITSKGRVYKFDSIECLLAFSSEKKVKVHSRWVVDFGNPGQLIPWEKALFLHTPRLPSPMGLNVAAFSEEEKLKTTKEKYKGRKIPSKKLLALYKQWRWNKK